MKKRRNEWKAKLGYKAGALAFRLVQWLIARRDPLKAERLGRKLGRWGFKFAKKHSRRAVLNLKLAFPELSEQERDALALRCFEHFGMLAADTMRVHMRTKEEMEASVVEIEGWEHAEAALAMQKGVIVVTGHFGNWERSGSWVAQRGFPLHVVQRNANDPGLNEQITKIREAGGMVVLSRGSAARGMLEVLKQNKMVAVLADQNCAESFVPFFGYPTGTVLGPAVIHLRTGSPILPAYCAKVGPNQFKIIMHPLVEAEPGAEDPRESIATQLNASLESVIRQYPEQWLWLHDRWKSARRRGLVPGP